MKEKQKCNTCKWFKVGYGHCVWCIHNAVNKKDKSCKDNYEQEVNPGNAVTLPTDIDDLKQYVTNLLYAAYSDGNNNVKSPQFDKWVIEEWTNIEQYFTSQLAPAKEVADEMLLNKFGEFLEEETVYIVYHNNEQGMDYLVKQFLNIPAPAKEQGREDIYIRDVDGAILHDENGIAYTKERLDIFSTSIDNIGNIEEGKKEKCKRLQDNSDGICPDCGKDHYEGRNV